jgi:hypothetical protein
MIKWEEAKDISLSKAKAEGKLILMDFFNPG